MTKPVNMRQEIQLQACKIEEDGEVLRDFVTVEHDGVGYMYDKVRKRLFRNQGTRKFAIGGVVE